MDILLYFAGLIFITKFNRIPKGWSKLINFKAAAIMLIFRNCYFYARYLKAHKLNPINDGHEGVP